MLSQGVPLITRITRPSAEFISVIESEFAIHTAVRLAVIAAGLLKPYCQDAQILGTLPAFHPNSVTEFPPESATQSRSCPTVIAVGLTRPNEDPESIRTPIAPAAAPGARQPAPSGQREGSRSSCRT